MKSSSEFIIETLKSWKRQFKGIELRYAFQNLNSCHLIEVSPKFYMNDCEQYKSAEEKLWMDFLDQYPDEEILITSPSDCHDMISDVRYNSDLDSDIKISSNIKTHFSINNSVDYSSCIETGSYTFAA